MTSLLTRRPEPIRGQASQTGQCLWKESPYTGAGFSYTPPTYRRPLPRVLGHRRRRPAARRGGRHVSLLPLSGSEDDSCKFSVGTSMLLIGT
jgi:hypothetical protein